MNTTAGKINNAAVEPAEKKNTHKILHQIEKKGGRTKINTPQNITSGSKLSVYNHKRTTGY